MKTNLKLVTLVLVSVAMMVSCVAVQPAFSYSGSYNGSIPSEKDIISNYATLDLYDNNGNVISEPLFTSKSVKYMGTSLQETDLVSGSVGLKLSGTQTNTATFSVYYQNTAPDGEDPISLRIAVSTSQTEPSSGEFSLVTANSTTTLTVYDGNGNTVSPAINPVSKTSPTYYIFVKTHSENNITLTSAQFMSLQFNATFSDNGKSTVVSTDNRVIISITEIITDSSDEVNISDGDEYGGHPSVDIKYEGNDDNIVDKSDSEVNITLEQGVLFCIRYQLSSSILGGSFELHFEITYEDESGTHIYSTSFVNTTGTGFVGLNGNQLQSVNSVNAIENQNLWIGADSTSNISIKISGKSGEGLLGLGLFTNTVIASIVVNDSA